MAPRVEYRVIDVGIVTEPGLELLLNEMAGKGWLFDGLHHDPIDRIRAGAGNTFAVFRRGVETP